MIKQGAEAKLFLDKLGDVDVIIKDRTEKKYRIKQIDETIRKSRTSIESRLLSEAKRAGILTPKIFDVDETNHKIIMEYIDGERIKELLNRTSKNQIKNVCFEIGRMIGKLHSAGIVHGDITTSNMIFKDGKVYFIDFGLGYFSKKVEDQGTDLLLLEEALKSTHFKIMDICWKNVINGYKKEYNEKGEVLKRVEEIKKRARYMKR
jgi:Kae1-associated kinase Bud32